MGGTPGLRIFGAEVKHNPVPKNTHDHSHRTVQNTSQSRLENDLVNRGSELLRRDSRTSGRANTTHAEIYEQRSLYVEIVSSLVSAR